MAAICGGGGGGAGGSGWPVEYDADASPYSRNNDYSASPLTWHYPNSERSNYVDYATVSRPCSKMISFFDLVPYQCYQNGEEEQENEEEEEDLSLRMEKVNLVEQEQEEECHDEIKFYHGGADNEDVGCSVFDFDDSDSDIDEDSDVEEEEEELCSKMKRVSLKPTTHRYDQIVMIVDASCQQFRILLQPFCQAGETFDRSIKYHNYQKPEYADCNALSPA
ncbi:OLC1v1025190C1 [Oldenlandia corymbosa var. corymbosa]|uniref:OLC1v1025190C1 n=1 Tax=Oldenlandia corymbosa var. corymbosa TaxID=529605 RepID=A0AAV1C520_OLDCO|nr:OLC1v1025190C1 [Oldenlandia corymbosa var. corymbosa]